MDGQTFIVGGSRDPVTGWARQPGPSRVAGASASRARPSLCRPGGGRGSWDFKDYLRGPPSVKKRRVLWLDRRSAWIHRSSSATAWDATVERDDPRFRRSEERHDHVGWGVPLLPSAPQEREEDPCVSAPRGVLLPPPHIFRVATLGRMACSAL